MIWTRATLPRIRYDRLMAFGWKVLIPLSLMVVFFTALGIILEMLWLIPIISILGFLLVAWITTRRKPVQRANAVRDPKILSGQS
jgi:NADH-quinone oxidoreductase subunit H